MQYLTIHEAVDVAGVYSAGQFTPAAFLWNKKKWRISKVTMRVDERDGGVQFRHMSVVANNQVCRLTFNRSTETWWLEEVWDEPLQHLS